MPSLFSKRKSTIGIFYVDATCALHQLEDQTQLFKALLACQGFIKSSSTQTIKYADIFC